MERYAIEVVENATNVSNINPETPYEKVLADCMTDYLEMRKAEEQGLLLRLPCKVGDTVYTIHSIASNRHMICEIDNVDKFFLMLSVAEERFGKTVFLTKEEAEQALAEMKGV